jgi:hypothetical protein
MVVESHETNRNSEVNNRVVARRGPKRNSRRLPCTEPVNSYCPGINALSIRLNSHRKQLKRSQRTPLAVTVGLGAVVGEDARHEDSNSRPTDDRRTS